jgi:hypothetical protein
MSALNGRNISSVDLIYDYNGRCTAMATMNSGNSHAIHGECEDILKMFKSLESCMMSKKKLCYLRTWRNVSIDREMYENEQQDVFSG